MAFFFFQVCHIVIHQDFFCIFIGKVNQQPLPVKQMEKDRGDVKLKRLNGDDLGRNEGNSAEFVFKVDSDNKKGDEAESELNEALESCKPDAEMSGGRRSHMYRNKSTEVHRASL